MNKPEIEFSEFIQIAEKLEIRIGKILTSERVPNTDKLLQLSVDFGDSIKTCVTNLGGTFDPELFLGAQMPFVMNLKPSKMKGVVSEVMIMVGETGDGTVQLGNYSLGAKLL